MGHARIQWGLKATDKKGKLVRYITETGSACFGFLSGKSRELLAGAVGASTNGRGGWLRTDHDSRYPVTEEADYPDTVFKSHVVEYMAYPMFHKATLHSCWLGMEKKLGVAIKQLLQSIPQYADVVYELKPHKGYLIIPLDKQTNRQAAWHLFWLVRNICHHQSFATAFKKAWFDEELRNPAVVLTVIEEFNWNDKSRWADEGWAYKGNIYGSCVYLDYVSREYFAKWYNAPLTGDNPEPFLPDGKGWMTMKDRFGYTSGISKFFSDNTNDNDARAALRKILGKEDSISTKELLDAMNRIAQQ